MNARPARGEPRASPTPFSRDPLDAYLRDIRRFPVLQPDEERRLAQAYSETRDSVVAHKLVTGHLRLVVTIARQYGRSRREMLIELVQQGNVGLVTAVDKYRLDKGVRFSTYAGWWIRAFMFKFIVANAKLVRFGTTRAQRKLFFRSGAERHRLDGPDNEAARRQMAESLGVSEAALESMRARLDTKEISIDVGGTDGCEANAEERPDALVEEAQFRRALSEATTSFGRGLQGRERQIFHERWLLETPATLTEMGLRNGVSRERMRQIEERLRGRFCSHVERALGFMPGERAPTPHAGR